MKLRDMMLASMFAAVIAILGFLPALQIPFSPVPITAQTLGVMLTGAVLGAKRGALSLAIFLLLIVIGAPVLPGGRTGIPVFMGPSGGFLLSWPIAAFAIGWFVDHTKGKISFWKLFLYTFIGGIVIVYLIGGAYMAFVTQIPLVKAYISCLIFIPGDVIKCILASLFASQLHRNSVMMRMASTQRKIRTSS
ncbi:biotin transporter BioY [Paenisporosarcina sp. TG-14]|uniref:biotin transporter BioY n=1 Tax=Paenisporosarcina sp. TG-14 TaxID=1231057 RepID=UPI0003005755|nr:biotin transporter BioY [Paenisporosarcina sp. TG-14]